MKKVLLFYFLIGVSLFAQSYVDSLYDAIEKNNTKKIIEIANNYKVDLNNTFSERVEVYGDMEGWYANGSPLIYAIQCGNLAAIDTLLKLGANVGQLTDIYSQSEFFDFINAMDMTNRISIMPLMFAAYSDSTGKVVSFLINKGVKVNAKDKDGKTALMYSGGDSTKFLINAGADVNAKDNEGKTALMYAGSASVDLLIKNKANVNAKDNEGNTALLHAIRSYRYDGISTSINNAATDGEIGLTIKEYEATLGAYGLELIKLLINNGANVNIRNKEGETPLSLSKEFPKLTKLLRDSGAYLQ